MWKNAKQNTIVDSTTEATKEVIWVDSPLHVKQQRK